MMGMRVSKFCDKQTLGVLRQADAVMLIKEIWRKHGFSDACLYERLSKCGGMDAFQVFGRQPHKRFIVPTRLMILLNFKF